MKKAPKLKMADGGMIKRADGSYSKRGLWDNIRANAGSGKEPTKEMLKQEKKIKGEYSYGGDIKKAPMMKMKNGGNVPAEKYSYNYNQPYASTEVIDKDPGEMETLQSSNARYEEAPNKNKSKIDRGYLDNSLVDVNRDIVTKKMGGIIGTYKNGGTIHIKPENKGKFTATKKRTGKSTEELTHSKNPITKKRAIFAKNAKKWKHSKRH